MLAAAGLHGLQAGAPALVEGVSAAVPQRNCFSPPVVGHHSRPLPLHRRALSSRQRRILATVAPLSLPWRTLSPPRLPARAIVDFATTSHRRGRGVTELASETGELSLPALANAYLCTTMP